jgi:hypothetical protein
MPQGKGASANAETGSRASTEPASSLHPSGFDPARDDVVHFISANADKSANVTACGQAFAYPMRGNGWRASGVTCEECSRFIVDAAHAALREKVTA